MLLEVICYIFHREKIIPNKDILLKYIIEYRIEIIKIVSGKITCYYEERQESETERESETIKQFEKSEYEEVIETEDTQSLTEQDLQEIYKKLTDVDRQQLEKELSDRMKDSKEFQQLKEECMKNNDSIDILLQTVAEELQRKGATVTMITIITYIIEHRIEIVKIMKSKLTKKAGTTQKDSSSQEKSTSSIVEHVTKLEKDSATSAKEISSFEEIFVKDDEISPIAESVMGEDIDILDEELKECRIHPDSIVRPLKGDSEIQKKISYEKPEAEQAFRQIFAETVVEDETEIIDDEEGILLQTTEIEDEEPELLKKKLMYIEVEIEESVSSITDASPETDVQELPTDEKIAKTTFESSEIEAKDGETESIHVDVTSAETILEATSGDGEIADAPLSSEVTEISKKEDLATDSTFVETTTTISSSKTISSSVDKGIADIITTEEKEEDVYETVVRTTITSSSGSTNIFEENVQKECTEVRDSTEKSDFEPLITEEKLVSIEKTHESVEKTSEQKDVMKSDTKEAVSTITKSEVSSKPSDNAIFTQIDSEQVTSSTEQTEEEKTTGTPIADEIITDIYKTVDKEEKKEGKSTTATVETSEISCKMVLEENEETKQMEEIAPTVSSRKITVITTEAYDSTVVETTTKDVFSDESLKNKTETKIQDQFSIKVKSSPKEQKIPVPEEASILSKTPLTTDEESRIIETVKITEHEKESESTKTMSEKDDEISLPAMILSDLEETKPEPSESVTYEGTTKSSEKEILDDAPVKPVVAKVTTTIETTIFPSELEEIKSEHSESAELSTKTAPDTESLDEAQEKCVIRKTVTTVTKTDAIPIESFEEKRLSEEERELTQSEMQIQASVAREVVSTVVKTTVHLSEIEEKSETSESDLKSPITEISESEKLSNESEESVIRKVVTTVTKTVVMPSEIDDEALEAASLEITTKMSPEKELADEVSEESMVRKVVTTVTKTVDPSEIYELKAEQPTESSVSTEVTTKIKSEKELSDDVKEESTVRKVVTIVSKTLVSPSDTVEDRIFKPASQVTAKITTAEKELLDEDPEDSVDRNAATILTKTFVSSSDIDKKTTKITSEKEESSDEPHETTVRKVVTTVTKTIIVPSEFDKETKYEQLDSESSEVVDQIVLGKEFSDEAQESVVSTFAVKTLVSSSGIDEEKLSTLSESASEVAPKVVFEKEELSDDIQESAVRKVISTVTRTVTSSSNIEESISEPLEVATKISEKEQSPDETQESSVTKVVTTVTKTIIIPSEFDQETKSEPSTDSVSLELSKKLTSEKKEFLESQEESVVRKVVTTVTKSIAIPSEMDEGLKADTEELHAKVITEKESPECQDSVGTTTTKTIVVPAEIEEAETSSSEASVICTKLVSEKEKNYLLEEIQKPAAEKKQSLKSVPDTGTKVTSPEHLKSTPKKEPVSAEEKIVSEADHGTETKDETSKIQISESEAEVRSKTISQQTNTEEQQTDPMITETEKDSPTGGKTQTSLEDIKVHKSISSKDEKWETLSTKIEDSMKTSERLEKESETVSNYTTSTITKIVEEEIATESLTAEDQEVTTVDDVTITLQELSESEHSTSKSTSLSKSETTEETKHSIKDKISFFEDQVKQKQSPTDRSPSSSKVVTPGSKRGSFGSDKDWATSSTETIMKQSESDVSIKASPQDSHETTTSFQSLETKSVDKDASTTKTVQLTTSTTIKQSSEAPTEEIIFSSKAIDEDEDKTNKIVSERASVSKLIERLEGSERKSESIKTSKSDSIKKECTETKKTKEDVQTPEDEQSYKIVEETIVKSSISSEQFQMSSDSKKSESTKVISKKEITETDMTARKKDSELEDAFSEKIQRKTTVSKTTECQDSVEKTSSEDRSIRTVEMTEMKTEPAVMSVRSKLSSEESPRKKKSRIIKKKIIVYQTGDETTEEITEDKIREAIIESGGKATTKSTRIISSGTTDDLEKFMGQDNVIEMHMKSEVTTAQSEEAKALTESSSSKLEISREELEHVEIDPFSLITKPIEETFKRMKAENLLQEYSESTSEKKTSTEVTSTLQQIVTTEESGKVDTKVATDAKKLAMESQRQQKERSESSTTESTEIHEATSSTSSTDRSSSSASYTTQRSNESSLSERREEEQENKPFTLDEWDKPMGLPSPPESVDFNTNLASLTKQSTTRSKKEEGNYTENKKDGSAEQQSSDSHVKLEKKLSNKDIESVPEKEHNRQDNKIAEGSNEPVYIDLTYVPHFGDPHYCNVEFFRRIRSRYYVFSGTKPSKEVFNALLEAKQDWKDKEAKVTIIPTYETDTLGYWMAVNQEALVANNIDVAPSASRCTINLQDHETSCSAYRLEL